MARSESTSRASNRVMLCKSSAPCQATRMPGQAKPRHAMPRHAIPGNAHQRSVHNQSLMVGLLKACHKYHNRAQSIAHGERCIPGWFVRLRGTGKGPKPLTRNRISISYGANSCSRSRLRTKRKYVRGERPLSRRDAVSVLAVGGCGGSTLAAGGCGGSTLAAGGCGGSGTWHAAGLSGSGSGWQ